MSYELQEEPMRTPVQAALVVAVLASLCLSLTGCKQEEPAKEAAKPAAKAPAPKASEEKPSPDAPAGPEGKAEVSEKAPPEAVAEKVETPPSKVPVPSMSALSKLAALNYLPADTHLVFVAGNPQDLLARAGYKELTRKYASLFEPLVADVVKETGRNLLSPEILGEAGIDLSKPAGVAFLSLEWESFAFFVTLSSADKFKTLLYDVAARQNMKMKVDSVGQALLLYPENDSETCFLLKDDLLIFVASDKGDEAGLAQAQRVATLDAKDSLGRKEDLSKAAAELAYGKDLSLYMNLSTLMAEQARQQAKWMAEVNNYSRKELERLKKENAPAEELKIWEERAKDEEASNEQWRKRHEAETALMTGLVGEKSWLVAGGELSDDGLQAKASFAMDKKAFMWRLLRNGRGSSSMVRATDGEPLYLFHGHLDVPTVLEFAQAVAATENASLDEAKGLVKAAVNVDVDQEVIPLLNGELGFVATGNVEKTFDSEEAFYKTLGGAVMLGVTDAARTEALLEKLAALPLLAPLVKKNPEAGGWTVAVPEWRSVHVRVKGNHLVASTDPAFVDRLERKDVSNLKPDNVALKELLASPDQSGVWMMPMGTVGFLFFSAMGRWSDAMAMDGPAGASESEEYLKKKKELDELRKEVFEKREKVDRERNRRALEMVRRFGPSALAGMRTDGGVLIRGGQYFAESGLVKLIDDTIQGTLMMDEVTDEVKELRKQEEKMYQLQNELWNTKSADPARIPDGPGGVVEPLPAVGAVPVAPDGGKEPAKAEAAKPVEGAEPATAVDEKKPPVKAAEKKVEKKKTVKKKKKKKKRKKKKPKRKKVPLKIPEPVDIPTRGGY